jgi:hypothetical protein
MCVNFTPSGVGLVWDQFRAIRTTTGRELILRNVICTWPDSNRRLGASQPTAWTLHHTAPFIRIELQNQRICKNFKNFLAMIIHDSLYKINTSTNATGKLRPNWSDATYLQLSSNFVQTVRTQVTWTIDLECK